LRTLRAARQQPLRTGRTGKLARRAGAPVRGKFSEGDNKLSLNRIFEHGLRFESSAEHAGLQLVHTAAYVNHRVYAQIRETLRTERDGQALKLVRYTTGQDNIDEARYRPVL
jgi:hypothetical protein